MLHCPATLYIARHGDAEYTHPGLMSDEGGWLSELGRLQVTALARDLLDRRIAGVRTSTMTRAMESGAIAAEVLGLSEGAVDGLYEWRCGNFLGHPYGDPAVKEVMDAWFSGHLDVRVPGGESGTEVIERVRDGLLEIADQFRGENVLVFTHGGVMSLVLPYLSGNARNDLARERYLPNAVPAVVEVGDDGWQMVTWPGSTDPGVV